jgi:hypothetical protein
MQEITRNMKNFVFEFLHQASNIENRNTCLALGCSAGVAVRGGA